MNPTYPTPYADLNAVLEEMVKSMQTVLADNFLAACLQGSFALGDFDEHSDVDFIVALEEQLADDQVRALQGMHERIYSLPSPWAQHLEGSYFPKEILRRHSGHGEKLWYLDHGARSLIQSDHCNTIVVRWTVREKGVGLAGPAPASLVDPIAVKSLRRDILATLRGWGQEILDDPEIINNRFYQGFAVLSYCRMLHDLHSGRAGSKLAGAEWAAEWLAHSDMKTLDPSWAGLIERAWDCRPDPASSVRQAADPDDLEETLAFIRMVIAAANQYAAVNDI
jgi:predicted nucleotidyltransferase